MLSVNKCSLKIHCCWIRMLLSAWLVYLRITWLIKSKYANLMTEDLCEKGNPCFKVQRRNLAGIEEFLIEYLWHVNVTKSYSSTWQPVRNVLFYVVISQINMKYTVWFAIFTAREQLYQTVICYILLFIYRIKLASLCKVDLSPLKNIFHYFFFLSMFAILILGEMFYVYCS